MRVTMILADAAAAPDGKLYILGGGWSITAPHPHPYAIGLVFHVPWEETGVGHHLRLSLLDSDGQPVMAGPGSKAKPLAVDGQFEVGRPEESEPGTSLDFAMPIPIPPHPIAAGGHYEWRLYVDGKTQDDWCLPFTAAAEDQQLRAA